MNIVKRISSGRLALGLLGAALAATTILAPVTSAEAAAFGAEGTSVLQGGGSGATDIKVIASQKHVINAQKTQYRFAVKNMGPQDSKPIYVLGHAELLKDGKFVEHTGVRDLTFSLKNGMMNSVLIVCEAPAGYECGKARMTAYYGPDTNLANNTGIFN